MTELEIQGSPNFREVFACRSECGKTLKPARLYRSGSLAFLTEKDQAMLRALGLQRIIDLRSLSERQTEPSMPLAAGIEVLAWDDAFDFQPGMHELWNSPKLSPETARTYVMELYGRLPILLEKPIRTLFQSIATGRVPMLVHCAAGKDRTGIAIALLLRAAGACWEDIVADYEISAKAVDLDAQIATGRSIGWWNAEDHPLNRISPQVRAVMTRSDPLYLKAAFDAVIRTSGSLASFISEILGISNDETAAIRNVLFD